MNRILTLLLAICLVCFFPSCDGNKDEPIPSVTKRTVLIYALGSNNLAPDLVLDKSEMIKAAPDIAGLGRDVRVLLYSVASSSATEATLDELLRDSAGEWSFKPLKTYDRNTFSTDPIRMREVFSDLYYEAPSVSYGLVFWGHGTCWLPNFSDHMIPEGMQKSFGWDTYQGIKDFCDLKEIKRAIPDRMFDYIWFDLCYMMGIEVAYELRNKCDYIAGYPTEDWSMGMNYETTLPMLAAPTPDLAAAGKAFHEYYVAQNMPVTVTVMKTECLERLAQAAADIYAYGKAPMSPYGLMNYSRLKTALYDFGQYTRKYLDMSDSEAQSLATAFNEVLAEMTLYGGCSTKDFNYKEGAFNPDEYSGLSCYFPETSTAEVEAYYRSLDWPRRVFP